MHLLGKPRRLLGLAALTLAGATALVAGPASAHDALSALRVTQVRVLDAKTVDTTFTNPMSANVTDPSKMVFYAPHLDHETPHIHRAVGVALSADGRTVRATLDRGLHPHTPLCSNEIDPRCSDDELDWHVEGAEDIYGQRVTDHSWEVWAVGSSRDH